MNLKNIRLNMKNGKQIGLIVVLALITILYWQYLLGPVFSSMRKDKINIKERQAQINTLRIKMKLPVAAPPKQIVAKKPPVFLGSQTKQLEQITGFVARQFRWLGIDNNNMQHSLDDKGLLVSFKFTSSYRQFLRFFNILSKSDLNANLETVTTVVNDSQLTTDLTLRIPYQ